jgi:hypothetical protein
VALISDTMILRNMEHSCSIPAGAAFTSIS